jgi:hypothetical protein
MAPRLAAARVFLGEKTKTAGGRCLVQTERRIGQQIDPKTDVEVDKAREEEREDVPMAIYAIQRRRKALCLVP